MLWSALLTKRSALVRFLDALQDESADAQRRFLCIDLFNFKNSFRIVIAKIVLELVTALRDGSDAPPFSVAHFEYLVDELLRSHVAIAGDDAAVLIFHLEPSLLELLNSFQNAVEQIERLESCDYDRHFIPGAYRLVLPIAHHSAYMTRAEECLNPIQRRLQNGRH